MEKLLQAEYRHVYSYIVTAIPIDTIYNNILKEEGDRYIFEEEKCWISKYLLPFKETKVPSKETIAKLVPFERVYDITKLKELPWSVIFQR